MSVKHKTVCTVYRVESKAKGIGPFAKLWHVMEYNLPEPYYDVGFPRGNCEPDKTKVFGAPTKSAMREWIVEPRVLRSHSYVVRKYKVPVDKVVSSKIQSIFKKKDAQCVAEYDIVEFMKGKKNA